MDLSEMPPAQCYNINARFSNGRLVELPIKDDQRERTSAILRKCIPSGASIEEGFVTLYCSKPGARKSWTEKFLVVESISASGTDEYVAILGATAPSRFRESLRSDEDFPTSYPIGFSVLSKGAVEISKTSLVYDILADLNKEEQDKQENEREKSASKAADEERKQKEQERKDREEEERAIEAQSQNPPARM